MHALVIGGSGLLGEATVKNLLADGAKVTATYFSRPAPLEEMAKTHSDLFVTKCDTRSRGFLADSVSLAVKAHGPIDALVYAAGISATRVFRATSERRNFASVEEVAEKDLEEMLDLHVRGAFWACQAILTTMKQRRSGRIVILNSLDGVKALPVPVHFALSKAAMKGLVEALAKEAGEFGITVNQINLGFVNSETTQRVSKALRDDYLKHCSLERFAKPEEASALASWLVLQNTYLTGQSLVLDGGL
ncbi:MAG: SDR family NAD(P)-dependent oxidoreductase [Bdellovibrionia bacterium]